MKSIFKKISLFVFAFVLTSAFVYSVDTYAAVTHTVTFMYGPNINVQQVKHGKNAVTPTNIQVPGYTFLGWTDSASNITGDKVIIAMYQEDAALLNAQAEAAQANANAMAAAAGVPTSGVKSGKKYDNAISAPGMPYWDTSLKGVPGKSCVVRWYNGHNGELWKTEVVPYGTTLAVPDDPCIDDHYQFMGWSGSWVNITEDRNIMAAYRHVNKVTYVDTIKDQAYHVQWYGDGDDIQLIDFAPNHEDKYSFTGKFHGDLTNIHEDRDIYAIYERCGEKVKSWKVHEDCDNDDHDHKYKYKDME